MRMKTKRGSASVSVVLVTVLVATGGLLAASSAALAQQAASAETAEARLAANVDAVIDRALAEKRIVGTVVLIAHDGKVVHQRAAGLADREAGKPVRIDTLFRLASVSKPIVSAAAMKLIARGDLSLDDRVDKWLPQFRPKLESGESPPITIRQLLTHTSGLSYGFLEVADGPYHRARVSDGLDQPGLSLDENLRRLAGVPLLFPPGARWRYSLSIDVLGAVLEKVARKSLAQVVSELVTAPLEMRDTGFSVLQPDRLAAAYFDATPAPKRMSDRQIVSFGLGAGVSFSPPRAFDAKSYLSGGAGMIGTAPDLLHFLETIRQGGGKILPATSSAAMMSNQIGDLRVDVQGPGWAFGFGGSVLVDPAAARSPQSKGTWQWGGAYGHSWFVDPARKLTVVAFTNTSFEGMAGRYTVELRDAVYRSL